MGRAGHELAGGLGCRAGPYETMNVSTPTTMKKRAAQKRATGRKAAAPGALYGYRETGTTTRLRKLTRAGHDTRTKLLDAAELLFAEHGYDETSLRDVSVAADVNLALSTYHFGKKQRLFEEVVARRAIAIHDRRMQTLAGMAFDRPREAVVRDLIRGYVSPLVEARFGTDPHWMAYTQITLGLANLRRYSPLMRKHYYKSAIAYLEKFAQTLPGAERNALIDAFGFMVGAMLSVLSTSDRFARDRRPKSGSRREQMRSVMRYLVHFVQNGFLSLELLPADARDKAPQPARGAAASKRSAIRPRGGDSRSMLF
jgi:AcrR family transcriptional regulator